MPDSIDKKLNLEAFSRAAQSMIATNESAYSGLGYGNNWRNHVQKLRDYTPEEIERIIESGSLVEQQRLSRNYFYKEGYYKQILIYYATLLKYAGLLIPKVAVGKSLSTEHIKKRYHKAMEFIDNLDLPTMFTNCAIRALIDGTYYGVRTLSGENGFTMIDLPGAYCCSRFKDQNGNDLIEFDLSYFDTIADLDNRKAALSAYPDEIAKAYKRYKNGKTLDKWYVVPSEIGVCFPMFDGRPLFLSVIPKILDYEESLATERARDLDNVHKIIVQQIPHLSDGALLFEPEEAEEIHRGTVGMLKGDPNVSVLTTYADVEAITAKTTEANIDQVLSKFESNIYAQAGVSREIFSATGNTALEKSLQNDLALMMYMANKFSKFMSNLLNELFSNSNIAFKYSFLPISYYNQDKFVDSSFKLVNSGYSFLLPAVALGLNQSDFTSVKVLENELLKLPELLKPLQTAYTQSARTSAQTDEGGRPTKDNEDKKDQTIQNEKSLG